jgi:hypothetical protein
MPYTMEDFRQDYVKENLKKCQQRVLTVTLYFACWGVGGYTQRPTCRDRPRGRGRQSFRRPLRHRWLPYFGGKNTAPPYQ